MTRAVAAFQGIWCCGPPDVLEFYWEVFPSVPPCQVQRLVRRGPRHVPLSVFYLGP